MKSGTRRITTWAALALFAATLIPGCRTATGSGPERVKIGGVHWYVDYAAAVEVAREQDKALWVHFGENPG